MMARTHSGRTDNPLNAFLNAGEGDAVAAEKQPNRGI